MQRVEAARGNGRRDVNVFHDEFSRAFASLDEEWPPLYACPGFVAESGREHRRYSRIRDSRPQPRSYYPLADEKLVLCRVAAA